MSRVEQHGAYPWKGGAAAVVLAAANIAASGLPKPEGPGALPQPNIKFISTATSALQISTADASPLGNTSTKDNGTISYQPATPSDAMPRPSVGTSPTTQENPSHYKSSRSRGLVVQPQSTDQRDHKGACWAVDAYKSFLDSHTVTPNPTGELIHPPSILPQVMQQQFATYGSPLATLYITDSCHKHPVSAAAWIETELIKLGIDPNFWLAQVTIEDGIGTAGVAKLTHNLSNVRPSIGPDGKPQQPSLDNFRYYKNWTMGVTKGISDWASLLLNLYVKTLNLTSVGTIIPVYAPSGDNNDPGSYESSMYSFMSNNTQASERYLRSNVKQLAKTVLNGTIETPTTLRPSANRRK